MWKLIIIPHGCAIAHRWQLKHILEPFFLQLILYYYYIILLSLLLWIFPFRIMYIAIPLWILDRFWVKSDLCQFLPFFFFLVCLFCISDTHLCHRILCEMDYMFTTTNKSPRLLFFYQVVIDDCRPQHPKVLHLFNSRHMLIILKEKKKLGYWKKKLEIIIR